MHSLDPVVTTDWAATLPCLITSVRYPTALNVVIGNPSVPGTIEGRLLLQSRARDYVTPMVSTVDALPPVNWV